MQFKNRKYFIYLIVTIIFLSTFNVNVFSQENNRTTSIDNLAYKQEISIPIDTSLEIAKNQPIDMKIIFSSPCWAKDEKIHSVRVGFDSGNGLTEIDSQIYDLELCDNTHISSCSIVFLVPEEVDGSEKYYVLYDSAETSQTEYTDHLEIQDSHYFYEPISGQVIEFDYYGIFEDGFVVYAVVQKGELLGNPIALAAAKFKKGSKTVETVNLDQLGDFDFRYGIVEEPAYIGTSWSKDITKKILVDGNLMVRVKLECISPRGDIKSENIYTYYYSPVETKRIYINPRHEILKDINIDEPSTLDGALAGITSIKSRSASIDKMNVGDILPEVYLYSEDETIIDYSIPTNPSGYEREHVLATTDDIDIGSKAWCCLSSSSFKSGTFLINF